MIQPQLFTKYLKRSLVAIAPCMTFLLSISITSSPVLAETPTSPFGLGLEGISRTGGALRCPTTIIGNSIAPEDGGRTLSSRPTFYLYAENLVGSQEKPFRAIFFLRNGISGKIAYRVVARSKKSGLLKFTLPDNAPALEAGEDMRWHVRILFPRGDDIQDTDIMSVNAFVRLEQNEALEQAIHEANSNLEKARVYARYYYWYDAFDAYTQWLEANPADLIAMQE
ncbi:DUF928 domain-containing protein [Tumidithrix elongata RA019]|uniref:DUF928 domain-containing protein n=1 Tax=Tumidithrix elongata BACA0141 TaxID=2716417 RepID=A0AAW9PVV5_9CYAN|nr:DUF928 domain-containing protein [Tumidithrix elongata RA019]